MTLIRIPSTPKLLKRILEDPALPEKIRKLQPNALAKLINEVGLEDCGEIVALASPEQLRGVFDEDLWCQKAPGADEAFDAKRFAVWLEILLELGTAKAAERVVEMDVEFVTMALARLIGVLRFDDLRVRVAAEPRIEKAMASSLSHELEEYYIFSRDSGAWDAVLTLLVELDGAHHSFFCAVMDSCAGFTADSIQEADDLCTALTSEEQLSDDVAYEREKRREAQGYVTPADARAFLKLAEGSIDVQDHVSPAQLRDWKSQMRVPIETVGSRKRSLKTGATSRYSRVEAALDRDPQARLLRLEELNYLANVLVSGWSIDGRSPRLGEAAQLALETCEYGLKKRPTSGSFIEAFRAGWRSSLQR